MGIATSTPTPTPTEDKYTKVAKCDDMRVAYHQSRDEDIGEITDPYWDGYLPPLSAESEHYLNEVKACEVLESELYKQPKTLAECQRFQNDFQQLYLALRKVECSYCDSNYLDRQPLVWFLNDKQEKVYQSHRQTCQKMEQDALLQSTNTVTGKNKFTKLIECSKLRAKSSTDLVACDLIEVEIYKKPKTLADCQKFKSDFQEIYLAWLDKLHGSVPSDKPMEWFFDDKQKRIYNSNKLACQQIEREAVISTVATSR